MPSTPLPFPCLGAQIGAIVGDVSDSQATVWSRADANSTMYVSLRTCRSGVGEEELMGQVDVDSSGDYTGQVRLTCDTRDPWLKHSWRHSTG